ncbi:MAG: NlpC/P60 family protein [Actinobacteria bacterium]|jgi:cell wall-associated NlpC family hydrolase|nr:NlpC/P60 family protein [Actinomycetota bacterium]NBP90753.1 NlpC/P60 family protein [Actinomycetota bacterium]
MADLGKYRRQAFRSATVGITLLALTLPQGAVATPSSITAVARQVAQLQSEAADAAENANAAKVKLAKLQQKLSGVKGEQATQSQNVDALKKNLGKIALQAYMDGGMGQGMQLLFAKDPGAYLASAGSLEVLTRTQSIELRRYSVAAQRLQQTSLLVNDQLKQIQVAQKELSAQAAAAQGKLRKAERLLSSLKSEERARLAALEAADDASSQKSSLASAKLANKVSGRAGTALRFALKQIGDRYYFGAAGPTQWDCSGLTMVAFSQAGISLPHSSSAQFGYGRRISRASLKPGDLVFFYSRVTHVGIYLGNGLMVHAPRPGKRVQVASISSMPFRGGVRL